MEVELNDTLNKTWKQDKTGFGFRMLQKMGWKEDKGLGKNESGIVDNVKIQKRETGLGLGSQDIVDSANRGWSATATSFNDVLDVLKKNYKKKDEKKKSKAKKSAPVPTISVGMKYKKMREAKDMTTKTEAEKRAIFGSAMTKKTTSSTTAAGTAPSSRTSSEASTTTGGEEDAEKVGHAPVVDVFSAVKAAVQGSSSSSSSSSRGESGSESGEEGKGAKKAKKEKKEKKEKRKEKK